MSQVSRYRQRIWQCETSGRSHLTYTEAVESERHAAETLGENFPDALRAAVLRIVHGDSRRIEQIVDDVYDLVADEFFPNEIVDVERAGYNFCVRVLEKISSPETAFMEAPAVDGSHFSRLHSCQYRYTVRPARNHRHWKEERRCKECRI